MTKKAEPAGPGNEMADASFTTTDIERILSNFVADKGAVRAPFVYKTRWVWSLASTVQGGGPMAHVTVTRAPPNVKPTPDRFVEEKGRKR